METSLRYGGDSKALRIRAKEKFPVSSNAHLELHGELDTRLGAPTYFGAMIRNFYPDLSASFGVGLQYNRKDKLHYRVRGKKAFAVTNDGLFHFRVKAQCDADQEFRRTTYSGAAEFTLTKFDIKKDQDVRIKVGYEVFDRVPYLQIRENNWTFNTNIDGRWNLRYDL